MPINFNRNNQEWLTSGSLLIPPLSGTITVWVKRAIGSLDKEARIFGTDADWSVRISTDGNLRNRLRNTNSVDSVTLVLENEWTHGAFTYSGSPPQRKVFFNGVFESADAQIDAALPNANLVSIGRSPDDDINTFWGSIFDVRLYNKVLSSEEIKSIFNARGSDQLFSGLINSWRLDELSNGVVPINTGAVVDMVGKLNMTRNNTPTYEAGPFTIKQGRIANG